MQIEVAKLISDYREQVSACQRAIEQNIGVISFCEMKIKQLITPVPVEPAPSVTPEPELVVAEQNGNHT